MSTHHSHDDIVKRLKRAEGHLGKIIEMIESGRGCLDVAQQMHAVYCAIENAKKGFIHDHIDNCLDQTLKSNPSAKKANLREFKEITKYL